MVDLEEFRKFQSSVEKVIQKKAVLSEELNKHKEEFEYWNKREAAATKAREILTLVGRQTQDKISFRVTNLVTMALNAVFPEDITFDMQMVERRNQTECDLLIDGRDPLESDGGGAADIASFSLRASFWSMRKNRPTILIDETFKDLSEGYHDSCSEMLSVVCEKLGLQIIMVSHLRKIIDSSDNIFRIHKGQLVDQVRRKHLSGTETEG